MNKTAFITDLHLLETKTEKKGVNTLQNWKTVVKDLTERGIKNLIFGGDLGTKEALKIIFEDVANLNVQVILGNHDHIENFDQYCPHASEKNELFYNIKLGNFQGIFLDTSSSQLSGKQQEFLHKALESAQNPVLFIHHPLLDIGAWMDRKHPLKNRKTVQEIIESTGKKTTVFCGHYHQFHETSSEFIRQIIAPAVSYRIPYSKDYHSDTSTFGYLIVDFDGNKPEYETVIFKK